MKGPQIILLEGALYVILGAFPPVITALESNDPLTGQRITVIVLLAVVGGATALKAFLSQAFNASEPQEVIVKNPPAEPVPTDPQP